MSLGEFNLNTKESKQITNPEGVGLGAGGTEIQHINPAIPTFSVSVKESPVHQSDVQRTFTGPFAGTGGGSGGATNAEDTHGFHTPTGNKIQINGAAGSESIEIVHHTGATIMIDADGAIFLIPTGRKGFGLSAGQGDGVINAAQRVVIKGGAGITLETDGNLELNVGQHLFMDVGGDFVLNVDGATTFASDGTLNFEATKDLVETIGGIKRTTIAGDLRTQVVGNVRTDAGKMIENRSGEDFLAFSQKSIMLNSKESSSFEVDTGKLQLMAKDDLNLASTKSVYLNSTDDIVMEATGTAAIRSSGPIVLSTEAALYADVSETIDLRSSNMYTSTSNQWAHNSGGPVDLRGSTIDLNKAAAVPLAVEITKPRAVPSIFSPSPPEFPDANTVIDSMTSEREAPDFPANAKKMNAEEMSRYVNEGGTPNPKARARAQPNQGAGSPTTMGSSAGSIPDSSNLTYEGSNNNQKGEKNTYPRPASLSNGADKLSRIVTVGMLPGLMRCGATNNGLSRAEIIENAAHLAFNVIDPILKQFGNRIKITDHLRIGSGGSRHYSGKAVDMASGARNFAETAEAAKWVRDNVAFDRLFLEANHAGTVHMHIEAAPVGSSGARTVWTCADPHCNSRQDGLNLAFAEQGLKKMGFA
jgi:uncharacterized protein (DUF2345 family)